jgi:hypothetical protein
MTGVTLLPQISKLVTVDIDSMDQKVAVRHTSPSFSFRDMTSNQAVVQGQVTWPESSRFVERATEFVQTRVLVLSTMNRWSMRFLMFWFA